MNTSSTNQGQQLGQNLGFADRQIRAVIGTVMLTAPVLTVSGSIGAWGILMLASVPVLVTTIMGWDPLYALMGKSTYEYHSEDIHQRHWTHNNIGIVERGIRFALGIMLLTALMGMPSMNAAMAFALLSVPLIVTAITAWDPFYAAMSMNSFSSISDVEAAEPGMSETTLAEYYEFPQSKGQNQEYVKAA